VKLLTVKQVAEQAGVSQSLVYSWVENRLLAVYRLGGKGRGKIMVAESDLAEFLARCRVESQAPKVTVINVQKSTRPKLRHLNLPPS
jgi:excisionase family DNA binding protein